MVERLPPGLVAQLSTQALTYPEVGATRGSLPLGYRHQRVSTPIGHGAGQYEAAVEALLTWQMHLGAGLRPRVSADRAAVDVVAVLRLGVGRVHLPVPVRVVALVEEPARRGFVYGTLPGHPERGEESFVVSFDDDGTVRFDLVSFSRPGRWFTRIGAPLARVGQRLFTERYLRALHLAAQSTTAQSGVGA